MDQSNNEAKKQDSTYTNVGETNSVSKSKSKHRRMKRKWYYIYNIILFLCLNAINL